MIAISAWSKLRYEHHVCGVHTHAPSELIGFIIFSEISVIIGAA